MGLDVDELLRVEVGRHPESEPRFLVDSRA